MVKLLAKNSSSPQMPFRHAVPRQALIAVPDCLYAIVSQRVSPGGRVSILGDCLSYLRTVGLSVRGGWQKNCSSSADSSGKQDDPGHVNCFLSKTRSGRCRA